VGLARMLNTPQMVEIASLFVQKLSNPRFIYTDEQKERIWLKFVARASAHERKYKAVFRAMFEKQSEEVLGNMPKKAYKATQMDVENWMFDKPKWNVRFSEAGQLLLPRTVEEAGSAELESLIVGVDFDVSNPRVIQFIEKRKIKLRQVNDTTEKAIRKTLTQGIDLGEGIPELRNRVQGVFTDASKNRATMIARSETIRASNAGAEEAYIQSGVVEGKEWLTALDERTCLWCEEMNGKTMGLGENFFALGEQLTVDGQSMRFDYDEVRYPPLHPSCYSEDTEIYTRDGFIPIPEIGIGDEVLTLEPESRDLEWAVVTHTIRYSGPPLYHITNKQNSFSMMITKDHPFFGYKRVDRGNKGRICEPIQLEGIESLNSEFQFYTSSRWKGEEPLTVEVNGVFFEPEDYCRFMGYYLSEGSTLQRKSGRYQVSISQSNHLDEMWSDLGEILVKKCWLGKDKIYISDNRLGEYLIGFGKSHEKYVPDELKKLSPRLIRIFLDAYLLGDGHIKKAKRWKGGKFEDSRSYSTASKQMSDDLGELLIKTGKAVSYNIVARKGDICRIRGKEYFLNHDVYTVYELTSQYKMFRNMVVEKATAGSDVYDLEVNKNHTILTRHNGKVVWGSNCRCTLLPIVMG
jgi:SPP1 gp7 family putative phage head morphogenesis protein